MYQTYWQLSDRPFDSGADTRFFFPAETHQAALLKLRYAIENRRGGALLTGPAGTGKTLVCALLAESLSEEYRPLVRLVFPQMSSAELLSYLASELDGERSPATAGVHHSIQRIESVLQLTATAGRHAVVIIDEAHLIDDASTLEALRLLMNFEVGGQPSVTLLLCGQTGLLPVLGRMPQLEERLAVKCMLRPLDERETAAYVEHRLVTAGGQGAIVGPAAVKTLQQLSHGVPRRINRLCDLALLLAFADQQSMLTPAQFEAVAEELAIVAPE